MLFLAAPATTTATGIGTSTIIESVLLALIGTQVEKVLRETGAYLMDVLKSLNHSEDELASMSTSEVLALLPESAKNEIRRMAREAQHPYEVRRRVNNPRLSYSTSTGSHGSIELDNGLAVSFSCGRPENNGQYTVRSGDSVESIAQRFGLDQEVLSFANRGLNDERLRPGLILNIPLSGGELRQAREALASDPAY